MTSISSWKWLTSIACFSVIALALSCSKEEDPDPGEVTTDENLYINEIYASGSDWIELYNASASPKDISGYKVYDDPTSKYTLPNGTSVPANGHLVIHCDDLNTGLHTNFKLTSSGETVYLENKGGELIDKVVFPALNDGQSYGRFPDGSATFKISGTTTQGSSNGSTSAPVIVSVTRTPLVVTSDDDVTVKAKLESNSGVSSVKLYYRINNTGSYSSAAMTLSGDSYSATIPKANVQGRVDYYVEVKSNEGATVLSPFDAPQDTHKYLMTNDELPKLVINEFMASNTSFYADNSSGVEEFDDWIEIYNYGTVAVNIAGMYLSDDMSNPFNHKIPDGNPALTTIQPGGYLIIWADNDKDDGPLHLDFSLSADGEEVGLYYLDGRTIDETFFTQQEANTSMARIPNGTGNFVVDNTPTPGAANE